MNIRALISLCVSLMGAGVATAHADPAPSLDAPATAPAGSKLRVKWTGPGKNLDQIGVVPAGTPDTTAPTRYTFAQNDNPAQVTLSEEPGEYELRYIARSGKKVLFRRKLTILPVSATLDAPKEAAGGARVTIRWTGPNNHADQVAIVPAGTAERTSSKVFHYTSRGNPLTLTVPETPGAYEIRYLTGGSRSTLARAALTIGGASASLTAPASVVAGTDVKVTWQGPNGHFDRIQLAQKGAPDRTSAGGQFTSNGSPLRLRAPLAVGSYELRYVTGASGTVLARTPVEVTPASVEPGLIRTTARVKAEAGGAVEIVLDASGSMLDKLGQERRIDVAKRTLAKLTSEIIPKGTPFALRVFGRGADTCGSALDLPLAPLDPSAAAAKVAAIEAKPKAKTGIGAALEQVTSDLATAQGERVVILVTDGAETCGGNPARTIQKLAGAGTSVRVNIVGFAVDNEELATTFGVWANAGGGSYFDARDAKGLGDAFSLAVLPAFEVLDAKKQVVAEGLVGGDPVKVLPGTYTVSTKGSKSKAQSVSVRARQTSDVSF
jgi:Mg-chelatase subunit ChlD